MSIARCCFGLLIAMAFAPVRSALAQDDYVEVTVTGESMTEDGARYDALRKALEQAGKNEISSHSEVDSFELIRDTIYARAEGIMTDYKIIEKGEGAGGTKLCTIRARVSKSAVATTWGEVQNVLEQLGRPGITVFIQERIDGQVQDGSILESQIQKRLLDAGFLVYAGEQVRAIAEKESADAASEANVTKVQAIAKDFGSQIFITGTGQANAAGVRELAGESTAMYNCDAVLRMYYSDTGELLASESLPNTRGGARGFFDQSPQAGKKALETAGQALIDQCYNNVMKRWSTRISAGGDIVLEVEGWSVADALKFKKRLQEMDPDKIRNVNYSLTKGIATFRIKAKMTAEELAAYLSEADWASSVMEIVDVKTNRLQARKIGS